MAIKTTHNFINSDFETDEKMQNISFKKGVQNLSFSSSILLICISFCKSGALFQIMKFKKVGSL
jgi:hypothetical protein